MSDRDTHLLKAATTLDAAMAWPLTHLLLLVARGENITNALVEAGMNNDDSIERATPRTLWLGVWSENFGAQRFYARYGFEKAGEYLFPVGDTNDLEFILRRLPHPA
mgnify:CR=1 FL=1